MEGFEPSRTVLETVMRPLHHIHIYFLSKKPLDPVLFWVSGFDFAVASLAAHRGKDHFRSGA